MPAIADQVAKLEHDHSDALADIDALKAENAALADAFNAVTAEKAALEAKIAELSGHNDALIAMAEGVANSALNMLKATRLPKDTPAAVIPYAPKTAIERTQVASIVNDQATDESAMRKADPRLSHGGDETRIRLVAEAEAPLIPAPPGLPQPPTSAVDRIKRHLMPAVTLMRQPPDTRLADPGGLPMFLRRDTVFARAKEAA